MTGEVDHPDRAWMKARLVGKRIGSFIVVLEELRAGKAEALSGHRLLVSRTNEFDNAIVLNEVGQRRFVQPDNTTHCSRPSRLAPGSIERE